MFIVSPPVARLTAAVMVRQAVSGDKQSLASSPVGETYQAPAAYAWEVLLGRAARQISTALTSKSNGVRPTGRRITFTLSLRRMSEVRRQRSVRGSAWAMAREGIAEP